MKKLYEVVLKVEADESLSKHLSAGYSLRALWARGEIEAFVFSVTDLDRMANEESPA